LIDDPLADDDLCERVRRFLGCQHLATLRRLGFEAKDGSATVDGVVNSFHERQLAVAYIQRVAGVRRVIDMILVVRESELSGAVKPNESSGDSRRFSRS
jgi:osmotically-inducible protein OsmY